MCPTCYNTPLVTDFRIEGRSNWINLLNNTSSTRYSCTGKVNVLGAAVEAGIRSDCSAVSAYASRCLQGIHEHCYGTANSVPATHTYYLVITFLPGAVSHESCRLPYSLLLLTSSRLVEKTHQQHQFRVGLFFLHFSQSVSPNLSIFPKPRLLPAETSFNLRLSLQALNCISLLNTGWLDRRRPKGVQKLCAYLPQYLYFFKTTPTACGNLF